MWTYEYATHSTPLLGPNEEMVLSLLVCKAVSLRRMKVRLTKRCLLSLDNCLLWS